MNIAKTPKDLSPNNTSLKEALAIMKGMANKKNENGITVHHLAKEIYQSTLNYAKKVSINNPNFDQIDDVMETPQATHKILLAVKQNLTKILTNDSVRKLLDYEQKDSSSQETSQSNLINQIKERQHRIKSLEILMMESQKNFKNLQLKLLNNIKKMNVQLHEKELQLNQLKEIIAEKDEQLESLTKVNQKKYRRIRELEEDMYDLQIQLEAKKTQLEAQRNFSTLYQKKMAKIVDQSYISGQELDEPNNGSIQQFNLASELQIGLNKDNSQIGVQTQKMEGQQKTNQQQMSQLEESRQSKYLESIERLTSELSEAYQRINELTKHDSAKNLTERRPITKTKTSSTYFSKKRQ